MTQKEKENQENQKGKKEQHHSFEKSHEWYVVGKSCADFGMNLTWEQQVSNVKKMISIIIYSVYQSKKITS